MKKRIMFPLVGLPVALIVGFIGLFIYCQIISNTKFSFRFTPEDYVNEELPICARYNVPENKIWKNGGSVSFFRTGAQYDFYIDNRTSHNLMDVKGQIFMTTEGELDSKWNFEGDYTDGIINFELSKDVIEMVKINSTESFGITFNSYNLIEPEYIIVEGRYQNSMRDFKLYYVLLLFAIIWVGFFVAYILFRFDRMKLIEKEIESSRVITGLASMYETVFIIVFATDEIIPYKGQGYVAGNEEKNNKMFFDTNKNYKENFEEYLEKCLVDDVETLKSRIGNLELLKKNLEKEKNITFRYCKVIDDKKEYLESVYVLLEGGERCAVMIRNVDEETQREMAYKQMLKEAADEANRANQAKTVFLSRISHEIRTPMNAIIGLSNMVAEGKLDEDQRKNIGVIKEAGEALLIMINDILDLSKIEAGKMELNEAEYDPYGLLNNLRILLETRVADKSVTVLTDLDENLPKRLYGDELKLRQVIINLANNAIKFTQEGSVKIRIRVQEKIEDRVKLMVSVEDTGMGIKEEDLEKLFESFTQVDTERNREVEGSGLGLSISKQMVEILGGHIEVKSEYGKGSEFFFVIEQKVPDVVEEEEDAEFVIPDARLLIVDDNNINLVVSKGMMESFKANVVTVNSGKKAIEILEEESESFDIVFMDFMMPKMTGKEATEIIRNNPKISTDLVIVGLTADNTDDAPDYAQKAGMNDYLLKPMNKVMVKKILRKWISKDKIIES